MIKLIIFDWDDVFSIGSKEGYFKCYQAVLDEFDIHLDDEEKTKRILAHWGQPYHHTIDELLREKPEKEKGYEVYRKNLFGDTYVSGLHFIPGANELLLRLHKQYILAIASGVQPKLLKETIFPKFNIPKVFTEIITSHDLDDSSKSKPHPYMVQEIMRRCNVSADETIMVGDAKNDVLMAQAAGITPIVVLTGHLNRNQAEDLQVKHIIEDVTKVEELLNILS